MFWPLIQQPALLATMLALQLCVVGCTKDKYIAKPIDQAQIIDQLINKDVTSAGFNTYLLNQGYLPEQLPFSSWGLDELTYCALYHHTKLNVAKAQLALANAQIESANLRQSPAINSETARSNRKNNDISPWALGLNVQIPIETTNKRAIRVEEVQFLVEAAKLDVADVAWELRAQIAKDLLRYHQHISHTNMLTRELDIQTAIIKILQKRVDLGAISNTELSSANLIHQKTRVTLLEEQAKLAEIRVSLAADVGLTKDKFAAVILKPLNMDETINAHHSWLNSANGINSLQADALLNRIDVRRSLAKYSAAEARIKLTVAMQTPDITLSPGYIFEFGDSIWSLGFSSLLNLLNKNQTLIKEATGLREIEGAQFEALQAAVIATLNQKIVDYQTSHDLVKNIKEQLDAQLQHTQKINKQFEAGLIDRLELTLNQSNGFAIEKQLLAEKHQLLRSLLSLENVMQKPLIKSSLIYN